MAPAQKTQPASSANGKPPVLRGRTIRAISSKAKAALQALRSPWQKRSPSRSAPAQAQVAEDAAPVVSPPTDDHHDEATTPAGADTMEGGLEMDLDEYQTLCLLHRLDVHSFVKESEDAPPRYYYSRNEPYQGKWFYYEARDMWISVEEIINIVHELDPTPTTIIKALTAEAAEEIEKGKEGEEEGEEEQRMGPGRETWYMQQKRIVSWLGKIEE